MLRRTKEKKKKRKKNSRRSTNVLLSSQEAVAKAATVARMTGLTCALLETRLPKMLNTSVLEKEVKKKGNNEFVTAAKRVCPCVVGLLKIKRRPRPQATSSTVCAVSTTADGAIRMIHFCFTISCCGHITELICWRVDAPSDNNVYPGTAVIGFHSSFFKNCFFFFITACPLISKRSRRYCLSRLSWSINVVGERRATVFYFHVTSRFCVWRFGK